MRKYLILLIAIALVAVAFAGCTSSAPATVAQAPIVNKYSAGDVITETPSSTVGMIVTGYDARGDVYILEGAALWDGKWMFLDRSKSAFQGDRARTESLMPNRVSYISPQLFK